VALAAPDNSFLISEPRRPLSAENTPLFDLCSLFKFSEQYSGLGSNENGTLSEIPDG
jgi:hypothetical protein